MTNYRIGNILIIRGETRYFKNVYKLRLKN